MAKATVGKFAKQSYEEFRIDADFGLNMGAAEALVLVDCDIQVWDVNSLPTTIDMLDATTKMLIVGSESGIVDGGLQVLIKGGTAEFSPYKVTFYGVTNLTPPNKWEKDAILTIKELPT